VSPDHRQARLAVSSHQRGHVCVRPRSRVVDLRLSPKIPPPASRQEHAGGCSSLIFQTFQRQQNVIDNGTRVHESVPTCFPSGSQPEAIRKVASQEGAIMKFTKAAIGGLAVPDGKAEVLVWDEELPGFGCRVRAGGSKTWIAQYRVS